MLHRLPHMLVSLFLFVFLCVLSLAQHSDKLSLVAITVTDIARAPIPHAKIELIPASGSVRKQLEADNDGKLSIRLAPGEYDITVRFPAFVTATGHIQVDSSANQTVNFALAIASCPPGSCQVEATPSKIPLSISHKGKDEIGSLFTAALNRAVSDSDKYAPMRPDGVSEGFRLYIQLATIDVGEVQKQRGKRSAVSIAIEDMGTPNSWPVPSMWYHKVVIVNQETVEDTAKQLLHDMDAAWCNHIKSSLGGCPKETL